MDKRIQFNVWYFVAAFIALTAFQIWMASTTVTERITYSAFLQHLEAGDIATVTVDAEQIRGSYSTPQNGNNHFITNIVPEDLTDRLAAANVEFDGTVQNTFLSTLLSWVMPLLIIFAFWMFLFRRIADKQGMGGLMAVGKSKAKVWV